MMMAAMRDVSPLMAFKRHHGLPPKCAHTGVEFFPTSSGVRQMIEVSP